MIFQSGGRILLSCGVAISNHFLQSGGKILLHANAIDGLSSWKGMSVNANGTWKSVIGCQVKVNGVWKTVTRVEVKGSGAWKLVHVY